MNSTALPIYEPPRIRDLSDTIATGQVTPDATCRNGTSVFAYTCATGEIVYSSTCTSGTYVSTAQNCAPTGSFPEDPRCRVGGSAIEGCRSGSFYE